MVSETTELASKLISLPSYVSDDCDEQQVIGFLAQYAREYLPRMKVELSPIDDSGRSNLYIKGVNQPRIVFVGHVDTVQPSAGWNTPPLEPVAIDGILFGLGSADMKGSIASLLIALRSIDDSLVDDVAVLLYVDEEYRFAGMKQLLKDGAIDSRNQPEMIISLDGGLQILSGCRGLIKIDMELIGKSGHASNPANGINAITNAMRVMSSLDSALRKYASELGVSTMNLARMNGGAVADIEYPVDMQRSGNVIPNYLECIVEVRTASRDLNASEIERIIRTECKKRSLEVKSLNTRIDLGSWQGSFSSVATDFLERCYREAGVGYERADPQNVGYIDVQMLAEAVDSPMYVIGAGGVNRHGANENVSIKNLETTCILYQKIITNYLGE